MSNPMPQAFHELLQQLKALPNLTAKQQKAIALVENITGTAGLFIEHVKLRYPKKKRIFRKRDRTTKRFKKKENALKLMTNSIQIQMSMMQHEVIRATPIRKYPSGSLSTIPGGLEEYFSSNYGMEIIQRK